MRVEHGGPNESPAEGGGLPPDGGSGSENLQVVAVAEAEPEDVRVVAVDTRGERRRVMRQLLEVSFRPGEIAEADSQAVAIELVERCHPDLVVLEIQMPLDEGLDTIAALRLMSPRPRIVVCSFHRDPATIQSAYDRGADAYVTKPASAEQLRAALGPLPTERAVRHRPPNERPGSPGPSASTPPRASGARPATGPAFA
jgi:CheY-like chemotaxis protein